MRRPVFLLAAVSAARAAVLSPRETPAPVPALYHRQDAPVTSAASSSLVEHTFAYYSGGDTEGLVLWAPLTYVTEQFTFTSSGDYWRGCSSTLYFTIGTSVSLYTDCPMWTTCSLGWLVAESTSIFCVSQGYTCYSELLYKTYGGEDPLSALYCDLSMNVTTTNSYYLTKPPDKIPASTTGVSTTPSSSGSPSPSAISSNPPPTSPATPPPSPTPAPSKSNNTAIIAGSVVGGVAVLALAGVAILFIFKRKHKPVPIASVPEYASEKPQGAPQYAGPAGVGTFNPNTSNAANSDIYSAGSASPPIHSPVPAYDPNWNQGRNELQG